MTAQTDQPGNGGFDFNATTLLLLGAIGAMAGYLWKWGNKAMNFLFNYQEKRDKDSADILAEQKETNKKLDSLITVTETHSEKLDSHGIQIGEIKTTLDSHGKRIEKLEKP